MEYYNLKCDYTFVLWKKTWEVWKNSMNGESISPIEKNETRKGEVGKGGWGLENYMFQTVKM